jgi:hypothetical protein
MAAVIITGIGRVANINPFLGKIIGGDFSVIQKQTY